MSQLNKRIIVIGAGYAGLLTSVRLAGKTRHQSVKITEKYYAAWTESRQRQVEADLERAWSRDPIVLLESKVTRRLRGETEVVN